MDIRGLVESMSRDGALQNLVGDPLAQFGNLPDNPFLLADLLPERPVPVNEFTEEGIRYRTVVANAGTRYSPAQKKGGAITGAFRVTLGHSDIAGEITSADYDALIRMIEQFTGTAGVMGGDVNRPAMQAIATLTGWANDQLNQPLLIHNEVQRSQALCAAQITLLGDDNYREVVNVPNPTGHRVTAGGTWSSDAYDPYPDMIARLNFLALKGFKVNRIITSTTVRGILSNNAKMRTRAGWVSVASGGVTGLAGYLPLQDLNALLGRDGMPPLELYDRVYFTQTGYNYILPRDTMLFIATTGRDERIERGDLEPVIKQNTLGYTAVGRAAGQPGPGRVAHMRAIPDNKPPRIEGEAWQASLAVVTIPEAVTVVNGIA